MNTINGKPTGDITAQGARSSGEQWGHGKDTVSMTYEELSALWMKVKPGRYRKQ